jgi:hypothetical protein
MRFNVFMTVAWFVIACFFLVLAWFFQTVIQPALPIIPLFEVLASLLCAVRCGLYLGDVLTALDDQYC